MIQTIHLQHDGDRREARPDGTWFRHVVVAATDGATIEGRTDEDVESGFLVLSGTLDLEAGAGSWISRGTRNTPFDGKPVAIFLPPKTRFRAGGGRGEILVISARRPERPAAPEEPARKPLLPLAGSGKAFDSASGSWQPVESFPDSAEAILPRRITASTIDGAEHREVFALDYKCAGLTLGEWALPAEATTTIGTTTEGHPEEWLAFVRCEGQVTCSDGDSTIPCDGEVLLLGRGEATLHATGGRAYVALACSGPKTTT